MDYGFPIHNIGKSERIDLLESSVIGNCGYLYKKLCLKFQPIQDRFVLFVFLFVFLVLQFLFSIYEIVGSMDIYKSLNINVPAVMKNPKIPKFIPKHLKIKKIV